MYGYISMMILMYPYSYINLDCICIDTINS